MTSQPTLMDALAEAEAAQSASTFNAERGTDLKEIGMYRAATSNPFLAQCKAAVRAAALLREDRTATADDSARFLLSIGLPADALGNAAGSLFRGDDWEWTGRLKNSERESNHSHSNKVWRLK